MDLSILELYILTLLDRGLRSKYELQREGGVSLGSSTPALKRLRAAGLITQQHSDDGTKRVRQIVTLTAAGHNVAHQGWRQHFDENAKLDVEAILRIVEIARYRAASRSQIIGFLKAMASQRNRLSADTEKITGDGIVGLQCQLAAYRAKAEAMFLENLAKPLTKSRKRVTSTNQPPNQNQRPSLSSR